MVCMAGRLVPSVCYGDGQTTNADTIPRTIPLLTNENSSAIVRIVCPSSSSVSIYNISTHCLSIVELGIQISIDFYALSVHRRAR
jgi:hypothetical protein